MIQWGLNLHRSEIIENYYISTFDMNLKEAKKAHAVLTLIVGAFWMLGERVQGRGLIVSAAQIQLISTMKLQG